MRAIVVEGSGRDAALVRASPQITRIKEQMQVDAAAALKLFNGRFAAK